MLVFNRAQLRDRIHACWVGKNIGGTMGAPYEGRRELLEITGYASPPGRALPNDDLDLQLVWLKAVAELGPQGITAQALGEYWLSYIGPNWNEYGVGKSNLREGLPPQRLTHDLRLARARAVIVDSAKALPGQPKN